MQYASRRSRSMAVRRRAHRAAGAAARRRAPARARAGAVDGRARRRGVRGGQGVRRGRGAVPTRSTWISRALVATVPFGFLAGLLRSRLAEGAAVAALLARRRAGLPGEGRAAGRAGRGARGPVGGARLLAAGVVERYVDALGPSGDGRRARGGPVVEAPAPAGGSPRSRTTRLWPRSPSSCARPAPRPRRWRSRTSGSSAELRARIEELRSSRARLVEAGDAAAAAAGARPARRRAVAARRRSRSSCRLARMKVDRGRRRPAALLDEAERPSCGRRSTSCASWPAGSTRRSSPTAGWRRRWGRWRSGRRRRSR